MVSMPTNPLTRFLQPAEQQIITVSHNGEVPDGQPTVTQELPCTTWRLGHS